MPIKHYRTAAVVAASFFTAAYAHALVPYTFNTLVSFNKTNGAYPMGALIEDAGGNLYGTTYSGGINNYGTVFQVSAGTNALTTLAFFHGTDGNQPEAGLVADRNGNLYGTAADGGSGALGTVFELAGSAHTFGVLANGDNFPGSNLVLDSTGNLYGTGQGVSAANWGTVFQVNSVTHALTTIASFNHDNGAVPYGQLIADSHGNLYGTTQYGGTNNLGTAFEITADTHQIITLANFGSNTGSYLYGGLSMDSKGDLFGTTSSQGPNNGFGSVFEITGDTHTLNIISGFSFAGNVGGSPRGTVVVDSNGDIFGTTSSSVFEIPAGSNTAAALATGLDTTYCTLLLDAKGNLFGTTETGGDNRYGSVFELSPTPEPATIALAVLTIPLLLNRRRAALL